MDQAALCVQPRLRPEHSPDPASGAQWRNPGTSRPLTCEEGAFDDGVAGHHQTGMCRPARPPEPPATGLAAARRPASYCAVPQPSPPAWFKPPAPAPGTGDDDFCLPPRRPTAHPVPRGPLHLRAPASAASAALPHPSPAHPGASYSPSRSPAWSPCSCSPSSRAPSRRTPLTASPGGKAPAGLRSTAVPEDRDRGGRRAHGSACSGKQQPWHSDEWYPRRPMRHRGSHPASTCCAFGCHEPWALCTHGQPGCTHWRKRCGKGWPRSVASSHPAVSAPERPLWRGLPQLRFSPPDGSGATGVLLVRVRKQRHTGPPAHPLIHLSRGPACPDSSCCVEV